MQNGLKLSVSVEKLRTDFFSIRSHYLNAEFIYGSNNGTD